MAEASTPLIVGGCVLAAGLSLGAGAASRAGERAAWWTAAAVLAAFGLDKAYALQASLIGEAGAVARAGGWYAARRGAQRLAMVGLLLAALALAIGRARPMRMLPMAARVALLAAALLALHACLGLISYHGWDRLVSSPVGGTQPWVMIELALPALVALAALRRLGGKRHRPR